ncbi:hypothetical protein [Frateuria defendens]|uniref:hypothetical protein n=1 Tax=Frateuria defendens TaxID=2219559 RepID=UPI00066FBE66
MDTAERIMAWAIPGFFVLIAVEWLLARRRGRKAYRLDDAINSLSLGMLSQIAGVFAKVLNIGIYAGASRTSRCSICRRTACGRGRTRATSTRTTAAS